MKMKGLKGPSNLNSSLRKKGKRQFYAGITLALALTFLGTIGAFSFAGSAIEEFRYGYYLSGVFRILLAIPAGVVACVGGSYAFIFIRFVLTAKKQRP